MNYRYIEPFEIENVKFLGAYCFQGIDRSFLLSKSGSSIVLSNDLIEKIEKKDILEKLIIKLYQRGFVTLYNRERFFEEEDNLPTFFMIDFTTKCNMNCIYCLRHFENVGDSIKEEKLYDICEYIIKYCKKHNIKEISFQPWGGEPLIEIEKFIESKKIFERAGIKVKYTVQTNGLLLTQENYKKLQDNHIGFGISIDGIKEVHDSHRVDLAGNKTFDLLLKRIKDIKEINPKSEIYALSVNSMYTINHIEESICFLVENLGIKHVKFNLVHPNGEGFDWNMLIKKENMEEFATKVFNGVVNENKKGFDIVEANMETKMLNLLNQSDKDICHSNGCKGGRKFVSFDQQGNIYPCEMIGNKENCLGNIKNDIDLAELVEKGIESKPYFKNKIDEKCNTCPYYYFCKGGCTASAMAYNKKTGEIDDMECNFNRAIYPLLIELILENPKMAEKIAGNAVDIM